MQTTGKCWSSDQLQIITHGRLETWLFYLSALFRRALAMFNREERAKRENQILSDFRSMVHKKIGKQKT